MYIYYLWHISCYLRTYAPFTYCSLVIWTSFLQFLGHFPLSQMQFYHSYELVGKSLLRTFFLEHIVLYQEFFMQEMFIMFQKGNPVPWPYITFRALTSCYQWPVSSFSSSYVLSWSWLELFSLWYLSFRL